MMWKKKRPRCLRVDTVGQTAEVNLTRFDCVHQIDRPFDAAPQSIQFPHDQRVAGT